MTKGIYRKPQWRKDKGIKLIRVGGLGYVRQKNNSRPQNISKGLWAFIWPHFDWFFVSGEFSHKDGRQHDKNQWRKRIFWHKGDIFTPIDLREVNQAYSSPWDNRWHITDDKRFFDAMGKLLALDLKSIKQDNWLKERGGFTGNPYYQSFLSIDHFEVFIPRRKRVLSHG